MVDRVVRYSYIETLNNSLLYCNELVKDISTETLEIVKRFGVLNISDEDFRDSISNLSYLHKLIVTAKYIQIFIDKLKTSSSFSFELVNSIKDNYKKRRKTRYFRKTDINCQICGENIHTRGHHLIPYTQGGGSNTYNHLSVCNECHKLDGFYAIKRLLRGESFEKVFCKKSIQHRKSNNHTYNSKKFRKAVKEGRVGRPGLDINIKKQIEELLMNGNSYKYIQEKVCYLDNKNKLRHVSPPTISEINKNLKHKVNLP